jgi:hypothetical protein
MANYLDSNGLLYLWQKIKNLVTNATSGKQDTLTTAQLNAANSGITAAKVTKYDGYEATINGKAAKATTLAGYGITDAYTKSETDSAINTAIGQVAQIDYQVVTTLPTTGTKGTIYLVSNSGTGSNAYDEYIYVNNAWEKIGTTAVDLSGYWAKADLVAITNAQIDAIVAQ